VKEDQQTPKRVLLDEMLPRLLARELPGHEVTTVTQAGWTGTVNGQLLLRMENAGIDVFITADRKMQYQQTLTGRRFGVVVLALGGTKLETLKPFADAIRLAVERVAVGELIQVGPHYR
jgi:hypothetical protein